MLLAHQQAIGPASGVGRSVKVYQPMADDVGRRRSKEAVNRAVAVFRAPAPYSYTKVGLIVAVLSLSRLASGASSLIVSGQTRKREVQYSTDGNWLD